MWAEAENPRILCKPGLGASALPVRFASQHEGQPDLTQITYKALQSAVLDRDFRYSLALVDTG